MTALLPVELSSKIDSLVAALLAGDFGSLEEHDQLGRLTVDELAQAVRDYPRPLVPLPAGWQEFVNVYGAGTGGKSIDVDLWTKEGRSDLTLSLTVSRNEDWKLGILNLHVL